MNYEILWKIHAMLMGTSFTALFIGILISHYFKKKKWRYKTHNRLGILAGTTSLIGLLLAIIMVQKYTGVHLTSLHTIAGAAAGLILLITPLIGLSIRKAKNKKLTRKLHKTIGYTTPVLVSFAILSGLMLTGLITNEKSTEEDSVADEVLVGDIHFSWKLENGYLEGTLKSPGKGYVAVGFNPKSLMEGADFVIGYVAEGKVFIRDDYGSWYTSHDSDISLGGSDNLEILGGSQDANGTIIRFRKPMDSEDKYDHIFIPGEEIPVIFAYSNEDSFTGMHVKKGKTEIRF